jgi:serine protease Do
MDNMSSFSFRRVPSLTLLGLLSAGTLTSAWAQGSSKPPGKCVDEYSDSLTVLNAKARELDTRAQSDYTFCVRNTAVYECLSYGTDGSVKKQHEKAVLHGTAFAYKRQDGDTLLLTNEHVAAWPAITDDEHRVEDVPGGCKKVSENIRIVDDEHDIYERDDVPLARVAIDSQLDVAVLKAHAKLPVMPWKIGHSAGLRARDIVEVHGFPLGAFKATNVGKVISALDHDTFGEWDHDDFVIDALLSSGNSGSPVLAASCKTGELELVGIFHANYSQGSAMNVVIGIDQVRDFMTTFKHRPQNVGEGGGTLGPNQRAAMHAEIRSAREPYFAFGPLTAAVHERDDGALVFEVFGSEFPAEPHAILVIEDLPLEGGFGQPGRVWFGQRRGMKEYGWDSLDAEDQTDVLGILGALRESAIASFAYRAAARNAAPTREHAETMAKLKRKATRRMAGQKDLTGSATDLADRLGPKTSERAVQLDAPFVVHDTTQATNGTAAAKPGAAATPAARTGR